MFSNYFIYLYTLSRQARIQQIFISIAFFFILFIICAFLTFLKSKYSNKEEKNSLFQKLLNRL